MPVSRTTALRVGFVVAAVAAAIIAAAILGAQLRADDETARATATPASTPPATDPTGEPTRDPTQSPGPSATPRPSATDTAPEALPEDVARVFAEIEDEVVAVRGLPAPDIGPAELFSRDEAREYFVTEYEETVSDEQQFADNLAFHALGLLEPDEDLADLEMSLLGERVLGFYDDEDKRMVVVTDRGLTAQAVSTYAHEYAHAIQDATFGIASLRLDVEGEDDAARARLSLLEGDAELVRTLWELDYFDPDDVTDEGSGPPRRGGLAEYPEFLTESLFFPYSAGTEFAFALFQQGRFGAVDAAYANPPVSTEQVLHPELYLAGHQPLAVELPDVAGALGEGWRVVVSTPMGEALVRIVVDDLGAQSEDAVAGALGWGGDRLVVVAGPGDEFALAWKLAWDTPADAAEFAAVYRGAAADVDVPVEIVELADGTVLVAHASSGEILEAVLALFA